MKTTATSPLSSNWPESRGLFDGRLRSNQRDNLNNSFSSQTSDLKYDVERQGKQHRLKSDAHTKPLVTVVSVVFNGERFLERTIQSVINQTLINVEYIIIDGGSTDGTIEIINKYDNFIDHWISEKDNGIYDAMNKGIDASTGEWISFLNAGDVFYIPETLSNVFNLNVDEAEIIFGNVQIKYPDFSILERAGSPAKLWSGMQFSHQSMLIRTKFHKSHKFNPNNRIAADLEFCYRAHRNHVPFLRVDFVIASVITGGVSESNRIKTIFACRDAVCSSGAGRLVGLFYLVKIIDTTLRLFFKKILPKSLVNKIIQLKCR